MEGANGIGMHLPMMEEQQPPRDDGYAEGGGGGNGDVNGGAMVRASCLPRG